MGIALAVIGFTSMIGQVVLMRELVATLYGNELVFGLILAAWLLWVAAGSAGLGRLAKGRRLGPGAFATGLALTALFLPAQMALTRAIRVLLDASLDFETLDRVKTVILSDPQVHAINALWGRNSGRFKFIEADIIVKAKDLEKEP